jgi:hypothetical protein
VLKNTRVQAFLDRVSSYEAPKTKCRKFTLTVAVPAESGSMGGWRVHALEVPGRSVRLSSCFVHKLDAKTFASGSVVWKYAKMTKEE